MSVNDFWLDKIDFAMNSLAAKCKELREENTELIRTVQRLESQYGVILQQRDEARRKYCHAVSGGAVTPAKIAHQNGWDCFTNLSDQE